MSDKPQKYWFKAKSFGYGWSYPLTWQGWVVYAVYFGLLGGYVWLAVANAPSAEEAYSLRFLGLSFVFLLLAALALAWICNKKGEPARWRWGKRK
jgi:hypothetical protein